MHADFQVDPRLPGPEQDLGGHQVGRTADRKELSGSLQATQQDGVRQTHGAFSSGEGTRGL